MLSSSTFLFLKNITNFGVLASFSSTMFQTHRFYEIRKKLLASQKKNATENNADGEISAPFGKKGFSFLPFFRMSHVKFQHFVQSFVSKL